MQAAGIADARARAGLLEYLAGSASPWTRWPRPSAAAGYSGWPATRCSSPVRQTYTLRAAAESIGVAVEVVEHGWAMLGLTVAGPDTVALSQADVDGLATWVDMREQLGVDAADGFLRVLGAAVARLAEAISSMIRASLPKLWLGHSGDELATAMAYREAARLHSPDRGNDRRRPPPPSGQRPDFHRGGRPRPVGGSVVRRRFRRLVRLHRADPDADPRGVVGDLLNEFGDTVSDVVHARRRAGGEVHRRRGDVGELDPERLAQDRARPRRPSARARGRNRRSAPASATAKSWP